MVKSSIIHICILVAFVCVFAIIYYLHSTAMHEIQQCKLDMISMVRQHLAMVTQNDSIREEQHHSGGGCGVYVVNPHPPFSEYPLQESDRVLQLVSDDEAPDECDADDDEDNDEDGYDTNDDNVIAPESDDDDDTSVRIVHLMDDNQQDCDIPFLVDTLDDNNNEDTTSVMVVCMDKDNEKDKDTDTDSSIQSDENIEIDILIPQTTEDDKHAHTEEDELYENEDEEENEKEEEHDLLSSDIFLDDAYVSQVINTDEQDYSKMSLSELKALAKERNIPYSKEKKNELIAKLRNPLPQM